MMKLQSFEQKQDYVFSLTFENGRCAEVDLSDLIARYVSLSELNTAQVDEEWGCLMFKDGLVDIEPKTLYTFVFGHEALVQTAQKTQPLSHFQKKAYIKPTNRP